MSKEKLISVPGVSFDKKKQQWTANFMINKKRYQSRYHNHFMSAVVARAKLEDKHGNFLEGTQGQAQQYVELRDSYQGLFKKFIKDKCILTYRDKENRTSINKILSRFNKFCLDQDRKILTMRQFIDFAPFVFSFEIKEGFLTFLHIEFRD